MMNWYNIIPYYIPNNRWTIPKLNMMEVGAGKVPIQGGNVKKIACTKKG
jgi:hypothetical protein